MSTKAAILNVNNIPSNFSFVIKLHFFVCRFNYLFSMIFFFLISFFHFRITLSQINVYFLGLTDEKRGFPLCTCIWMCVCPLGDYCSTRVFTSLQCCLLAFYRLNEEKIGRARLFIPLPANADCSSHLAHSHLSHRWPRETKRVLVHSCLRSGSVLLLREASFRAHNNNANQNKTHTSTQK